MRIANAITDLRRPPSIVYSDHQSAQPLSPTQSHMTHPQHISLTPSQSVSQVHTHSRSASQAQSHHSFPGAVPPVQHNLMGTPPAGPYVPNGNANGYGYGMMTPSESPATEYIIAEAMVPESERQNSAGLGVGLPASFSNGRGPVSTRGFPPPRRFFELVLTLFSPFVSEGPPCTVDSFSE
jgi:hypothetical protein